MSLLNRIADRIHARHDVAARAQGLTVTHLPGGRRQIHHPDLPALLEARRVAAIRHGLDLADRLLMDPGTLAALDATADHLTARRH
ncbi:hypothetical protein ACIBSW_27635 [Actinoplanes sp. NPDC049668]|uniref:hypothetical protein n=1 Tax=unclassified Actinoplanes TaxID=2626549 RepID=UPI0033AA0C7A